MRVSQLNVRIDSSAEDQQLERQASRMWAARTFVFDLTGGYHYGAAFFLSLLYSTLP